MLKIVSAGVRTINHGSLARSSRHKERPEIKGLRGSKEDSLKMRQQAYCVSRAVVRMVRK